MPASVEYYARLLNVKFETKRELRVVPPAAASPIDCDLVQLHQHWMTLPVYVHPSPKVMAEFFRHENQHDALIQFAQFLVDLWSVC